ncbi:hypothetical protein BAUCODRAFT_561561 [Baudoinia panamericana UAMH 10762]|uniref:Uncharacterized protein n=1 Tax=Baudoinia panamericana (strain UAMH 10762) TaxID=717646 RepID=M2MTD0_BAUPA|nr:uncharacterized protein BAUCODRAFT_561561 [Baudoinia panamericana UAMH 10762]EMC94788.1 hypothetical protein BAUCODRAFT_561561 [Baudoinia panamericana UAMH 10762]
MPHAGNRSEERNMLCCNVLPHVLCERRCHTRPLNGCMNMPELRVQCSGGKPFQERISLLVVLSNN